MWSICRCFNKEEPACRKGGGMSAVRQKPPEDHSLTNSDEHFCNTFYSRLWKRLLVVPWNIFQLSELSELWIKSNKPRVCSCDGELRSAPPGRQESPEDRSYRREEIANAALGCHSSRTRRVMLRNADCSGGSGGPGCLETARKQEITGIRPAEEVRSERMELLQWPQKITVYVHLNWNDIDSTCHLGQKWEQIKCCSTSVHISSQYGHFFNV